MDNLNLIKFKFQLNNMVINHYLISNRVIYPMLEKFSHKDKSHTDNNLTLYNLRISDNLLRISANLLKILVNLLRISDNLQINLDNLLIILVQAQLILVQYHLEIHMRNFKFKVQNI